MQRLDPSELHFASADEVRPDLQQPYLENVRERALVVLKRDLERMEKRGQASSRGLALSVATGSYWTRTRISEAVDGGPDDAEALCQRCDMGVRETPLHRFWCCPGNATIDGLEGAELQAQAVHGADEWPCFWLRGLTPAS